MLFAVCILCWRYLTGKYVFIFPTMINDGITQFYPGYLEAARNLSENGSVDFYSFSDGFGAFRSYTNPFQLMIILFGEQRVAYMMGVKTALCIFLSGWIMGLFLRQAGFARSTCIMGSLTYAFSMQVTGMGGWNVQGELGVAAAITLLVIEKILCKEKWYRWLVWGAIDVWLIVTCLGFYYELLYGAVTVVYVLVRMLCLRDGLSDHPKGSWKKLSFVKRIILTAAAVCASAAACVVLINLLQGIVSGSRFQNNFEDWGRQWKDTFSLFNLKSVFTAYARTLSPNIMGIAMLEPYAGAPFGWYSEDGGAYVGLLPLIFTAALPKTDISKKKKLVMLGLLLLACLFTVLPGVRLAVNGFAGGTFKLSRLWICLTLCMCGCLVWESVIARKQQIGFRTLGFSAAGILLPVLAARVCYPQLLKNAETAMVLFFSVIYLLILYKGERKELSSRTFQYLLLGVLGTELLAGNYRFINNQDAVSAAELQTGYYCDGTGEALALLPEASDSVGIPEFRVNKSYESVLCCDPMAQNYNGTTFYRGGADHAQTTAFLQALGVPSKSNKVGYCTGTYGYPVLSAVTGVRYGISEESAYMEQGYYFNQNLGNKTLYENQNVLPIAFGYTRAIAEEELDRYTVRERHDLLLQACILDAGTYAQFAASGNTKERNSAEYQWNEARPLREFTVQDYEIGTPIAFDTVSGDEMIVVNLKNEEDVCVDLYWSTTKGRWSGKDYRTLSIYGNNQNTFIEIDNQEEINGIIFYLNDDTPAASIDQISIQVYKRAEYECFLTERTRRLRETYTAGEVAMKQDGILFVSIPYDAPFTYYLDGQRCNTVRANYIFTGIPIQKGNYSLEIVRKK